MARNGRGRGEGLGGPFRPVDWAERGLQIADEVEGYLAVLEGKPLPDREDAGAEMPEPLYWLEWIERFGPVREGGSLDQPHHFMKDLEWAVVGRARREALKAANLRLQREYVEREEQRKLLQMR